MLEIAGGMVIGVLALAVLVYVVMAVRALCDTTYSEKNIQRWRGERHV